MSQRSGTSHASVRQVACPRCGVRLEFPGCATLGYCSDCKLRLELDDVVVSEDCHASALVTQGALVVERGTQLAGSTEASDLEVNGTLNGSAIAHVKMRLSRTAHVTGSVEAPRLEVENGASMDCFVRIGTKR